ncbi:LacI family DNA-binding transcriptional regulator [Dysgonomonas sp. 520]|uniref:LacI family DNA-binding transcriptional regulator n=1 Tax=Dysgonomonas sp. 520 TaxID=2302931 RepID=UPI001626B7D1|nr:LacI family DNA-binding transcriptional regulator [Dysgonomonas sp. 520]
MKTATIKDIALALGVSVATVSRALTNKHDVSEQMREKVLDMAKKLHYKPNIHARNLLKNKNNMIGVVVPEFITFFFPEIIIGIQEVLNPLGYQVLICQSNESSTLERKNVEMLENQMVEGLIISVAKESRNYELYERLASESMPIVFINRVINRLNVSKVIIDDRKWAFKAVEHLIKCGYRRIAHLAGNEHLSITQERLQGYLDALKAYDIPIDECLIMHVGVQQDKGKIGLNYLLNLKQKPDAIFAVNDPVAVGVLLELKAQNIKVPEEIAVVGFSESPIGKILGLTSVAQPTSKIGEVAAQMLLEKIQEPNSPPRTQILEGQLNIRSSSLRKKH